MDIYVREDSNSIKQQAMENILIALELSQGMNGELTDYNQRTDYGVNRFKVAILVDSKIFLKRITLIVEKKIIKNVFYPINNVNKHIEEVLKWLKENLNT